MTHVENSALPLNAWGDTLRANVSELPPTAVDATESPWAPALERVPTSTEAQRYDLTKISEERKQAILADLRAGMGVTPASKKHHASTHVVTALRRQDDEERSVDVPAWKRHTAASLARFVAQGSERLVQEVANIPLGQLPVAVAIAIDKINALHDQPQTVVEHRLRVSQEQISAMILDGCVTVDPLPVVVAPTITADADVSASESTEACET